jgi:DNA-binding NarL/FixJ family response regulator
MIAYLLAQICGFILYTWEVSALLQQELPQISYDIQKDLTRREREILTLMCRGHDQQAIATKLSIATKTVAKHREHIYERLGIHRESDVLLAAYLAGLYSPLEETTD